MRSLLAAVLVALGLVVFGPGTAYACSCVVRTPTELLQGADVVVVGTVRQTGERAQPAPGELVVGPRALTYEVEVETAVKGEAVPRTVEFHSSGSSASCGIESLPADRRTVVFLQRDAEGLSANSCGGTGWVSAEQVRTAAGLQTDPPAGGGAEQPGADRPGTEQPATTGSAVDASSISATGDLVTSTEADVASPRAAGVAVLLGLLVAGALAVVAGLVWRHRLRTATRPGN